MELTENNYMINAKREVVSYENFAMQMKDITLLTKEEYKKYKDIIPYVNFWWWLRSPSSIRYFAACVDSDGSLDIFRVNYSSLRVRPAIVCDSTEFSPRTKIKALDLTWTVLNSSLILCDESIGYSAFRENWMESNANDYDASDVKRNLYYWFNRAMRKQGE